MLEACDAYAKIEDPAALLNSFQIEIKAFGPIIRELKDTQFWLPDLNQSKVMKIGRASCRERVFALV